MVILPLYVYNFYAKSKSAFFWVLIVVTSHPKKIYMNYAKNKKKMCFLVGDLKKWTIVTSHKNHLKEGFSCHCKCCASHFIFPVSELY